MKSTKEKKKQEPTPPPQVIEEKKENKDKVSLSLDADLVVDLNAIANHPDIDRSLSYVVNKEMTKYRDQCVVDGLILPSKR